MTINEKALEKAAEAIRTTKLYAHHGADTHEYPGNSLALAKAAIEAYEAALWRPISEAPKDGTNILGRYQDDYAVIHWNRYGEYWILSESGTNADNGEWFSTHFRPLPTFKEQE